jgi:hypothetical protein
MQPDINSGIAAINRGVVRKLLLFIIRVDGERLTLFFMPPLP